MSELQKDKMNKIQLSLAATMFFAPFVKHLIGKGHLDLDEEDRKFIEGYIRFGYINLGILLIAIVGAAVMYFTGGLIFNRIYIISVGLLIGLLTIGIGCVMGDVSILQDDGKVFQYDETNAEKSDILTSFIPVYNINLRYKLHDFEHPYRWAKESIIFWTLFIIVTVATKSMILGSFVLTLIIIRVASLVAGIDIFDKSIKKRLNTLFTKNPEEVWGYVSGMIKFIVNKIKGDQNIAIEDSIKEEKESYQVFLKFDNKEVLIQYLLGLIFLVFWAIGAGVANIYVWIIYLPVVLILGRYGIMAAKWKHLPNLPIAKELTEAAIIIYDASKTKIVEIKDKYNKKK